VKREVSWMHPSSSGSQERNKKNKKAIIEINEVLCSPKGQMLRTKINRKFNDINIADENK
jgi:hypothetical protein